MSDKRVHITDLGNKHIFIEADVPREVLAQIIGDFKEKGFSAFGVATGNH
jgi:hypothetical protein